MQLCQCNKTWSVRNIMCSDLLSASRASDILSHVIMFQEKTKQKSFGQRFNGNTDVYSQSQLTPFNTPRLQTTTLAHAHQHPYLVRGRTHDSDLLIYQFL